MNWIHFVSFAKLNCWRMPEAHRCSRWRPRNIEWRNRHILEIELSSSSMRRFISSHIVFVRRNLISIAKKTISRSKKSPPFENNIQMNQFNSRNINKTKTKKKSPKRQCILICGNFSFHSSSIDIEVQWTSSTIIIVIVVSPASIKSAYTNNQSFKIFILCGASERER